MYIHSKDGKTVSDNDFTPRELLLMQNLDGEFLETLLEACKVYSDGDHGEVQDFVKWVYLLVGEDVPDTTPYMWLEEDDD